MADQYKVDLDELETTVTKLNGVLRDMESTRSRAKSTTYLPEGALGSGFGEAKALYQAHFEMQKHIHAIVDHLNDVIDDFREKTKKSHESYVRSEDEVAASLRRNEKAAAQGSMPGVHH